MNKKGITITIFSTLFLIVLCSSCGNGGSSDQISTLSTSVATLDTSSEQAFMDSLTKMEAPLTPEEREQFRTYLGALLTDFGIGLNKRDHKELNRLYVEYKKHDGQTVIFTGAKTGPLTSFHGLTHIEVVEQGKIRTIEKLIRFALMAIIAYDTALETDSEIPPSIADLESWGFGKLPEGYTMTFSKEEDEQNKKQYYKVIITTLDGKLRGVNDSNNAVTIERIE